MGHRRNWTAEEKEYLAENWGRTSIDGICKHLNRSRNAVLIMKGRLRLGAFLDAGEYFTVNQFFKAFGYVSSNSYANISWVKNRGFPVKKRKVGTHSFKVIYLNDFWKWADENRHHVPFGRLEKNTFGEEPKWVGEIREIQQKTAVKFKKTKWTPAEDSLLKFLLKQYKYGYAEISRRIGRTEGAVLRRCIDLGLKDRPVKADNHNKWTSAELETVFELLKRSYTYELISESLENRSVKAIKGIVAKQFGTENIDKVRCRLLEK